MEFRHKRSRALPSVAIEALGLQLNPYLGYLRRVVEQGGYSLPECSLCVPSDEYMYRATEAVIDKVYNKTLRYVFVIGIGGSNLGTKAIYDAMAYARDMLPHEQPKLIFLDTTSGSVLEVAKKMISGANTADELLFIVISKSGTTTETLCNAEIILDHFANKFGRKSRRVVVLSETGSPLLVAAREQQMTVLDLPPPVGGRYSVFTPVGLLPLGLMGFDIRAIRDSAERAVQQSLHPDISLNISALSALTAFYFYQEGYQIHDTFLFAPELESVGKWYRQLLAESIGKTVMNDENNRVGITPTVSIGSTDLHSVGQLYLGGKKDRLTTFVSVANKKAVAMPNDRVWPELLPMITGKNTSIIMDAIMSGTKSAYDATGLPFLDVELTQISPEEIAAFMQFKMCEVMMLGFLLRVNPFDQPHVEQYKTVTKQLLGG